MKFIKFKNILVIATILLGGCGTPPSFYTLTPKLNIKNKEITKSNKIVGVASVKIPDYLNRKEIITKVTPTQLSASSNQLWVSNLAENIQNVLKLDLSNKTNRYTFLAYPWEEPIDDIYRVYLSIDDLEMDSSCNVTIVGRWSIVDMQNRQIITSKEFSYLDVAQGCDYNSFATVTSNFIDKISTSIIKSLKKYNF